MTYDNTNRGALFNNANKTKDNAPDRNGSLNVNGVEYWLSGWLKTDKNGKAYLSLSVAPKEQQEAQQQPATSVDNIEDDIPF